MTVTPYQTSQAVAYAAQQNGQQQQLRRLVQGLSLLVYGFQKQGKSSIADTGPRPTLILDVETAANWTPSRKIIWDPARETVPYADGTWDSCVVLVHDHRILHTTLQVLQTGRHPFNSIDVDSVPTIQRRIMDNLAGYRKMERDHWGQMLREITKLIWDYRDLLTNPVKPVWSVTFVAGARWDDKQNRYRPNLLGQTADFVPYIPDLTGWLEAAPDGSRHLWSGPSPRHETGNRLWGLLPMDMQLGYPGMVQGWTVEGMVQRVIETRR
jgi:hypothetical protein